MTEPSTAARLSEPERRDWDPPIPNSKCHSHERCNVTVFTSLAGTQFHRELVREFSEQRNGFFFSVTSREPHVGATVTRRAPQQIAVHGRLLARRIRNLPSLLHYVLSSRNLTGCYESKRQCPSLRHHPYSRRVDAVKLARGVDATPELDITTSWEAAPPTATSLVCSNLITNVQLLF